jgi:alpha-tubulin suppressor-like RCC1 family protein
MIVPAISGYTTCGVQTKGTLWCWGDNQYGQLGQGTTDASTHSSPVQVGSATNWTSVILTTPMPAQSAVAPSIAGARMAAARLAMAP